MIYICYQLINKQNFKTMKKTINVYDFKDAFRNYGRQDQFSYDGLTALFEWLENYEEETGQEIELDVIALCCDFSEVSNIQEFNEYYDLDCEDMDEASEHTLIIPVGGESFIYQNF